MATTYSCEHDEVVWGVIIAQQMPLLRDGNGLPTLIPLVVAQEGGATPRVHSHRPKVSHAGDLRAQAMCGSSNGIGWVRPLA
jgi:hypothetical protein